MVIEEAGDEEAGFSVLMVNDDVDGREAKTGYVGVVGSVDSVLIVDEDVDGFEVDEEADDEEVDGDGVDDEEVEDGDGVDEEVEDEEVDDEEVDDEDVGDDDEDDDVPIVNRGIGIILVMFSHHFVVVADVDGKDEVVAAVGESVVVVDRW